MEEFAIKEEDTVSQDGIVMKSYGEENLDLQEPASPKMEQDDGYEDTWSSQGTPTTSFPIKFEDLSDMAHDVHDKVETERVSVPIGLNVCRLLSTSFSLDSWEEPVVEAEIVEGFVPELNVYVCGSCSLVFEYRTLYTRHLDSVHDPNNASSSSTRNASFPCMECGVSFVHKQSLQRHNRKIHGKIIRHKCSVCRRFFLSREGLNIHSRHAHPVKQGKKEMASTSRLSSASLTKGLVAKFKYNHKPLNAEGRAVCHFCPATFVDRNCAKKHMLRTHKAKVINGDFVLRSMKIGESSTKTSNGNQCHFKGGKHMSGHNESSPYLRSKSSNASVAHSRSRSGVKLKFKPLNADGRAVCHFCPVTFSEHNSAKKHMLSIHKALIINGEFVLRDRPTRKSVSVKSLKDLGSQHKEAKTDETSASDISEDNGLMVSRLSSASSSEELGNCPSRPGSKTKHEYVPLDSNGRAVCLFCPVTFTNPKGAMTHMIKKHNAQIINGEFVLGNVSTESQKRIACPYCSVSYSYVKSVKRHIREKHPKRSLNFTPRVITSYIKESEVSSQTSTKSSMNSQPKFSSAKTQHCNKCSKRFGSSSALKRHNLRTHLRILDYKCEFCGYRFCLRYSYRLHVERRHKDRVVHHDLIALNDARDWSVPPKDPQEFKKKRYPIVKASLKSGDNSNCIPITSSSIKVSSPAANAVVSTPNAFQKQLLETLQTSLSTASASLHLLQSIQPAEGTLPGDCGICHTFFPNIVSHYLHDHQMY